MILAVIGGKLQGVEAVYLARKAGIQTVLIDKDDDVPAVKMCDEFLQLDFENPLSSDDFPDYIDIILPALENERILHKVEQLAVKKNIPLAFNLNSFLQTNSKLFSDELFARLKLPAPKIWPNCSCPVIVKPDQDSGSRGIEIFDDEESLNTFLASEDRKDLVIQEYIEGPSYSLEVLGEPGNYTTYQVTRLHMDSNFDCCGVTAPAGLSDELTGQFTVMSIKLAEAVQLKGIMDVEVIHHDNRLKLLEIDARLPSQTPMTVFHSVGINMVEQLCNFHLNSYSPSPVPEHQMSAHIEHIKVQDELIEVLGEHIMTEDGPLSLHDNFFGADEAISSFEPGKKRWVATLIFRAANTQELEEKREMCRSAIQEFLQFNRKKQSITGSTPGHNVRTDQDVSCKKNTQ